MTSLDATAAKATAGTVTVATGLATYLEVIQSGLGIAASLLGVILTGWILYKELRAEMTRRKGKNGKLKRQETDG